MYLAYCFPDAIIISILRICYEGDIVTYIVTENCIKCKYMDSLLPLGS
jgi:hypothetical protein